MPAKPADRRPITLVDLMILVLATAVGIAVAQLGWPRGTAIVTYRLTIYPSVTRNLGASGSGWAASTKVTPVARLIGPILPCMATWTAAFLVARLRGPRPRWRRLIRQPGMVAALAVWITLGVETTLLLGIQWLDGRFGSSTGANRLALLMTANTLDEFAANSVLMMAHHASLAVGVAWLTMALTGTWRPELSWLDRWGRALGMAWLLSWPISSVLIDYAPWWGNFYST